MDRTEVCTGFISSLLDFEGFYSSELEIVLIVNNSHWLQSLMSLSHLIEQFILKQGFPHTHPCVIFIVSVALVVQSCRIQTAAFECQWYKHSKMLKHFLLMIIARSQKAVSLSGCQLYVVSLQTFGKVQYLKFQMTVSCKCTSSLCNKPSARSQMSPPPSQPDGVMAERISELGSDSNYPNSIFIISLLRPTRETPR
jgi:hypothetical protein